MWEIWANKFLSKAFKSCQKCKKSLTLVTLQSQVIGNSKGSKVGGASSARPLPKIVGMSFNQETGFVTYNRFLQFDKSTEKCLEM